MTTMATQRALTSLSRRVLHCGGLLIAVLVGGLLPVGTSPLVAQETEQLRRAAEQRLGRPLDDAEILRRIRQSGLTPAQIRDRLEARGFARSAADPWLRVIEGEASRVPEGTDPKPLVGVLAGRAAGAVPPPRGEVPAPERPARADTMPPGEPPVFGRALFRRATSQFQPVTTGPVPDDYRVGPGDQLNLVLTGAVEQAYDLEVSREGWIVIPDVGRVFVNGKTMEELEATLFRRLSEVYSGIRRGADATTHFDVTVGELRTSQVYVIGEVETPAAYSVSSLATALTALYHAGGPTRNGSFRRVVVNRGGETVARIDLYDYLVRGDAGQDVRLQQGDVVFVPVADRQVRIEGPVARPGIYELNGEESLRDLLRYAGGVRPEARLERVQIRRILPPGQREPGRHRTVLDVDAGAVGDTAAGPVPLRDGDRVELFAVLEDYRNEVTVSGGVWRPGSYGADEGTRLWDVIRKAGGLLPDVFEGRAQIQRLTDDYTRRMIAASLERGPDGRPVENPAVEGRDQIYVYAKRDLRGQRAVSVGGWVRDPGVYPYVEGMTVADLILEAGGLRQGVYMAEAQVARPVVAQRRTDTLTRQFSVPLDSSYVFEGGGPAGGGADGERAGRPDAAERFELESLDAVYVRKAPGFEPQKRVVITGEVRFPGPYSIRTRDERLLDLVRRAGGLTDQAYAQGFQLWRARDASAEQATVDTAEAEQVVREAQTGGAVDRVRVGIDFPRARRRPRGRENVLLQPADSVYVPSFTPTVDVTGAVQVPTKVLHREGAGLGYYIDQAGGYRDDADEDRVHVRFANGEIATKGGGFLFFGGSVPDPDPGSRIRVPVEPEREAGGGLSTGQWITLVTSVLGSITTVVVASN